MTGSHQILLYPRKKRLLRTDDWYYAACKSSERRQRKTNLFLKNLVPEGYTASSTGESNCYPVLNGSIQSLLHHSKERLRPSSDSYHAACESIERRQRNNIFYKESRSRGYKASSTGGRSCFPVLTGSLQALLDHSKKRLHSIGDCYYAAYKSG